MIRLRLFVAALACALLLQLNAQVSHSWNAQVPAGWKVRIDGHSSPSDPADLGVERSVYKPGVPGSIDTISHETRKGVMFYNENGGFHATNPEAAIYRDPSKTASGNYTLKGIFVQLSPTGGRWSTRSNEGSYYGLIFGASNLDGEDQTYNYFMVAQDGTWVIKRRNGSRTVSLSGYTTNDAVKKPGVDGRSENALEVRVGTDKIDFVVNRILVHSEAKTGDIGKTEGMYGIRVNQSLEMYIDKGFGASS